MSREYRDSHKTLDVDTQPVTTADGSSTAQSKSWQKDFDFNKADILNEICCFYIFCGFLWDTLLLYSLNAKHAKYIPKERGQVTPAQTTLELWPEPVTSFHVTFSYVLR